VALAGDGRTRRDRQLGIAFADAAGHGLKQLAINSVVIGSGFVADFDGGNHRRRGRRPECFGERQTVRAAVARRICPFIVLDRFNHQASIRDESALLPRTVHLLPINSVARLGENGSERAVVAQIPCDGMVVADEHANRLVQFRLELNGVTVDAHEVFEQRLQFFACH
jgi:hypothetical protein